MLIGGDGISNDVITLGTCFSMFVYIYARFSFVLIGGNLTAQSTRSQSGIGGGIQTPETKLQALLPFPTWPPERLGEIARRLDKITASCQTNTSPSITSYGTSNKIEEFENVLD